jgi:hypothetical protein
VCSSDLLARQITGGGRTAAPAFPQSGAPVVLAWRHAELAPAPSALQRLGRRLAERSHRIVPKTQARRPRLTMLTTRRAIAPPSVEPQEDKPTADEVLAAEPRGQADPRGSADAAPHRLEWRSSSAPKARRERALRPARRWLTGIALVLTAAAVSVIAIRSHTDGRAAHSHQASFATATSRPHLAVIAAAKTVLGVLGTVEHQARTTAARERIVARRARARTRDRGKTRHVHSHPARPRTASQAAPQAPAALPATSSAGGGGTASTGASSSQTSPAPSTSSSQSGGSGASSGVGSSSGTSDQANSASAPSSTPVSPTGATGALGPIGSPNG